MKTKIYLVTALIGVLTGSGVFAQNATKNSAQQNQQKDASKSA